MAKLLVKKLADNAVLPKTHHANEDAGIDLYTNESHTLAPGETHAFTTGIATQFETGYVALIWDRSSYGARGLHVLGGVIDAGYRGEWKVVLHNLSDQPQEIRAGDRIAQAILQRFEPTTVKISEELGAAQRSAAGFGSSGR